MTRLRLQRIFDQTRPLRFAVRVCLPAPPRRYRGSHLPSAAAKKSDHEMRVSENRFLAHFITVFICGSSATEYSRGPHEPAGSHAPKKPSEGQMFQIDSSVRQVRRPVLQNFPDWNFPDCLGQLRCGCLFGGGMIGCMSVKINRAAEFTDWRVIRRLDIHGEGQRPRAALTKSSACIGPPHRLPEEMAPVCEEKQHID